MSSNHDSNDLHERYVRHRDAGVFIAASEDELDIDDSHHALLYDRSLDNVTGQSSSMIRRAGPLHALNYANLCAYSLGASGVAVAFYKHIEGNTLESVIHDLYPTLVTPSNYAHAIWCAILFFQGIFTIVQLTPTYRSHALVRHMHYWYLGTTIFQTWWILFAVWECMALSLLCLCAAWVCLFQITDAQNRAVLPNAALYLEFQAFKFPFTLHYGWITCMLLLSVNMLGVYWEWDTNDLLMTAILTFGVLSVVGYHDLVFSGHHYDTNFVVLIVVVHYFVAMGVELHDLDPKNEVANIYDHYVVLAFEKASFWAVGMIVAVALPNLISAYIRRHFVIEVVEH